MNPLDETLARPVVAYVQVHGPDSTYWNPIRGTEAPSINGCQARLDQWIEARAAERPDRYASAQVFRATHRFQLDHVPTHAVGRYL